MRYYILLQAMGDNLITLQMLNQLKGRVNIIGTQNTKDIANLIQVADNMNIVVAFKDTPSFYNIRRDGLIRALMDAVKFRVLLKTLDPGHLIFEKGGFRAKLLSLGVSKYFFCDSTKHVYINRKRLIEGVSGSLVSLKSAIPPKQNIRKVLISPTSGGVARNINKIDLSVIVDIFKDHNCLVQLVDYGGRYESFKDLVHEYYPTTSLAEVKQLVVESDYLIGTDSFLIHLAYFYNKAFFIVFNYDYFDFLPPNSEVIGNYIVVNKFGDNKEEFEKKFIELGIIQ